ncbi:MAG: AAA family ATPase [Saprospiraceae bacterium]
MSIGPKIGKGRSSGLKNWITNQLPSWDELRQTDWFGPLYDCPQNPDYHAEGDVGVHTEMVVEALLQLPEYQALFAQEKKLLLATALFHDVAKPACLVIENGKVSSPRHAKVGEKMTREILWEEDFTFRETVCSLVRLHGLPIWALEKENPRSAVISASLRTSNYLLYIFAKADVLGRICKDKNELLERVEYFKEFCLENNCFEKPYPFLNAHSRFRYFFTNAEYTAELFDDTKFQIILMSGIAGSGKDTFLQKNKLPVISLDYFRQEMKISHGDKQGQGRVVQRAYELAKKYAAAKQSFIWNSTNLTADMRSKLINKLAVYNPFFKIIYLETSIENIFARRGEDIPLHKLEKMIQILDMPLFEEVHEVEYIRKD